MFNFMGSCKLCRWCEQLSLILRTLWHCNIPTFLLCISQVYTINRVGVQKHKGDLLEDRPERDPSGFLTLKRKATEGEEKMAAAN